MEIDMTELQKMVEEQMKNIKITPVVKVSSEADAKPEKEEKLEKETKQETKPEIKLVNVKVNNENDALNLIIGFLQLAQRRGVFGIDESAKIWECISKFKRD